MTAISKPLLTGLLASAALSVLMLLQPEEAPTDNADAVQLVERKPLPSGPEQEGAAWVRPPRPLPKQRLDQGFMPASPAAPVLAPVPVAPPKPVAPQPAFIYLGRMVRDGQTYVFLGYDNDVDVVAVGATVGGSWRVEAVTETGVELKYLPLNEVRQLAMSER